jgi:oxygen-independent coproporphyrinogen-3 oxidase
MKQIRSQLNHELVRKYSGSGPRYTSYPTAVEFHHGFDSKKWSAALDQEFLERSSKNTSLYFHIPFCRSLCYFCACNKVITQDRAVVEPYLKAVEAELSIFKRYTADQSNKQQGFILDQIHWGGGSPNYLLPEEMERLFNSTSEIFGKPTDQADVSIELDPRTTSVQQLNALKTLGFNRISLGVQDFDTVVQESINRIQSFEMTTELVQASRELGFRGVNIDLIYGLPHQSLKGFGETLGKILEIRPSRIALYGYAHVTWLQKVQRSFKDSDLPTPETRLELFILALETLSAAGYVYIGLDHFALPEDSLAQALASGKLNRNFMGYTTHRGTRIFAFGPSAISSLDSAYAQNLKSVEQYQSKVFNGEFATERGIARTADDRLRAEVIENILCSGEIGFKQFSNTWKVGFWDYFGEVALHDCMQFIVDGLLEVSSERLKVTDIGRLFARNISMIFDAYLPLHREKQKKVFSQTL